MWLVNVLTDGFDETVKMAIGEERLGKLSEKQLQGPGDDMNVLPLAVLQVQLLCSTQQEHSPLKHRRGRCCTQWDTAEDSALQNTTSTFL